MTYQSDLLYPLSGSGLRGYRAFLTCGRLMVGSIHRGCGVDLLRITKDTQSSKVEARWRVTGC